MGDSRLDCHASESGATERDCGGAHYAPRPLAGKSMCCCGFLWRPVARDALVPARLIATRVAERVGWAWPFGWHRREGLTALTHPANPRPPHAAVLAGAGVNAVNQPPAPVVLAVLNASMPQRSRHSHTSALEPAMRRQLSGFEGGNDRQLLWSVQRRRRIVIVEKIGVSVVYGTGKTRSNKLTETGSDV